MGFLLGFLGLFELIEKINFYLCFFQVLKYFFKVFLKKMVKCLGVFEDFEWF